MVERICKICGLPLRPLTKNKDWEERVYHMVCFKNMIKDIKNFDKTAFTKYEYKKRLTNGMTYEQAQAHANKGKKFVIKFD